jgi:hypothetical protein
MKLSDNIKYILSFLLGICVCCLLKKHNIVEGENHSSRWHASLYNNFT